MHFYLIYFYIQIVNNPQQQQLAACFSPDSQFVLAGSPEGKVHMWNCESGARVCMVNSYETSTTGQAQPIHCIQFNPKYATFATASVNTTFWLTNADE